MLAASGEIRDLTDGMQSEGIIVANGGMAFVALGAAALRWRAWIATRAAQHETSSMFKDNPRRIATFLVFWGVGAIVLGAYAVVAVWVID